MFIFSESGNQIDPTGHRKNIGALLWVQEIEVNSKTVFRVNFGVYSNRSDAERARLRLTQGEGFVKQVDGEPPIEQIQ